MDVTLVVTGDLKTGLKFQRFPQQAHDRILAAITRLTEQMEARVKGKEPRRTGKLQSVTDSRVSNQPNAIVGIVTVSQDFAKTGALEYGAHNNVNVKAYQRGTSRSILRRLFGPSSGVATAYSRTENITEVRFFRSSRDEMASTVEAELLKAVDEAAADES